MTAGLPDGKPIIQRFAKLTPNTTAKSRFESQPSPALLKRAWKHSD